MDGTTSTVIILIFLFSIIGAVTGRKDPVQRPSLAPPPPPPVRSRPAPSAGVHTSVDHPAPGADFMSGHVEGVSDRIKAFISARNRNISASDRDKITECILKYSRQFDVNPRLVAALIARESSFNKFAVSSSGAQGLGQLMPSTAAGLGVTEPFDIDQNVMGTTRYIRSMIDRFPGPDRLSFAIAGYFEGPNAVFRAGGFQPRSKSYVEDIFRFYDRI